MSEVNSIETDLKFDIICSNVNRASIIYLLSKNPKRCMQAEKMAYYLGISHRTVLYHLDILENMDVVEVKAFRKRGQKLARSVWGLKENNGDVDQILRNISTRFNDKKLEKMIQKKLIPR